MDNLRDWLNTHLDWMDTQMATQDSLRDSLGYHASSRLTLTLTDAQGNALQKDIAGNAPADALAAVGQPLKLTVRGGNDTNGTAVLYVNGRRISETATAANATTVLNVPAEALTARAGEKNVLEIQIEKPDGSINASRYVTVAVTATGVHEHSYEAAVTAPTCTEAGFTTYTCGCGDYYIADETPALGHTEVTAPDQEPTFDKPGMTGGTVCAVCGETLAERVEIPVRDYNEGIVPLDVLTATAGDWQRGYEATEGPAALVLDDDFGTIWHTDWYGTSRENHWLQLELNEEYIVDGLRCKPRQGGGSNGIITKYEIQVSDDGEHFETVASGEWENNKDWKVVSFEPQAVKYVRLVALDAVTDNSFVFASAAEIRLTGVKAGEDAFYLDPIRWARQEGITTETAFNPNGLCQRAQVVTFLWRAAGSPEPTLTVNPFVDVKESDFYYKAVLWALENGITTGMTAEKFGPYALCSRAQVVTFLWRAMGCPGSAAEVAFTDVPGGAFYTDAVAWAVANGITRGVSTTAFGAEAVCSRAQIVTFLYRTMA